MRSFDSDALPNSLSECMLNDAKRKLKCLINVCTYSAPNELESVGGKSKRKRKENRYQTESILFLLFSSMASFMNGLLARISLPHTTKRMGARDNANEMNARSVLAQL